jgi:hypothetical protein
VAARRRRSTHGWRWVDGRDADEAASVSGRSRGALRLAAADSATPLAAPSITGAAATGCSGSTLHAPTGQGPAIRPAPLTKPAARKPCADGCRNTHRLPVVAVGGRWASCCPALFARRSGIARAALRGLPPPSGF